MDNWIDTMKGSLDTSGEFTEVLLNSISLFFIVAGVIISLYKSIRGRLRISKEFPLHIQFRLMFGGWLVVALEFQLAADIVGTIVSPTNEHLIQLGAVALIRTFLNYFLNKELNEGVRLSQTHSTETKHNLL